MNVLSANADESIDGCGRPRTVREYVPTREEIMPGLRAVLARAGTNETLTVVRPELLAEAKAVYGAAFASVQARVFCWEQAEMEQELVPPGLEGSACYTIILATLGPLFDEDVSNRFLTGSPLSATLLDAWGSEAVEALVERVDLRLRREKTPLAGSRRFAPGYGSFDIRRSADWLDAVGAKDLPVSVDRETGLLSPRKSILCMIGWRSSLQRSEGVIIE